jgi:hypothetical protein
MPSKKVSAEQLIAKIESAGIAVAKLQSGRSNKATGEHHRSYACVRVPDSMSAFVEGFMTSRGFVVSHTGSLTLPVSMEQTTRDALGIKMRRPLVRFQPVPQEEQTSKMCIVDARWNTSATAASGLLVELARVADESRKSDRVDYVQ